MSIFHFIIFIWVRLSISDLVLLTSASCCPHFVQQTSRQFEQKTDRFWEFREQSNSWVEVKPPVDLVSCVNDNCTKVGLIDQTTKAKEEDLQKEKDPSKQKKHLKTKEGDIGEIEENCWTVLPQRKRISLTKMSETSIWVTGESGSIYERFWNGVQWVIAPHDLQMSAGRAISVLIVNQTILAISEEGNLYQMQLGDSSQPIWVEFKPAFNQSTNKEAEQSSVVQIKSGTVTNDGLRVYFCTKNGLLLELSEVEPLRWENHGRPPGADVAAIADAVTVRTEVVYTISSTGDLYEYDKSSRPSWKKHLHSEETAEDGSLIPLKGCTIHGFSGDHSVSLFLLTQGGMLVERRLHQRKWKWISHGSPEAHHLTSITPPLEDEPKERFLPLFLTTSTGLVFEYRIQKHSGTAQENQISEAWLNHMHPPNTKVARGIAGLKFQLGRTMFALDDGRLAELHIPGLGGENSGPTHQFNMRKKSSSKYVWSILDAPETEGWNAEYCTEERGPMNCIAGIKDEPNDSGTTRLLTRRRKGNKAQQEYLSLRTSRSRLVKTSEENNFPDNWINSNFRLRVMYGGISFFVITDGGLTFEYLYTESVWLWLRHDHSTPMRGALGNYNGSLFFVDMYGTLLIRERSNNELTWINCTAMRKGRQVIGGPPWDGMPGKNMKVTAEDALFFVSKSGRLLQFTVALRQFKWKDCGNPPETKLACIIDQEIFRENIVFVVGRNGRLYQYNKVTELWHEHDQSQHLVLSRLPGTAMRPSLLSLTGSLFMLSEDGGLVEYHWNAWDGWNWVEHGTPCKDVTLVGPPGPCFEGNQLFLIGSDGNLYLRYMDQLTWRWKNCGFPRNGDKDQTETGAHDAQQEVCIDNDITASLGNNMENPNDPHRNCDPKVAATRPIPFSEDTVIFELKDGRLAEIQNVEDTQWVWVRIIGTPTSLCTASYWTALAA
ncbi:Uncharacterized protein TCM_040774 isoform 1 [Theobroma cacao]|uniref:Uncharacterized protein isoform 1 n=1 Tax=Theobroma cacao TaxID=3641 RepID=A0A061GZB5_THECC|nr:Uncharacterized protein TCM_040774 isoform 1 [Theobroma cacao]EOY32745.1 Uncharacterized protein TCM_040774 isoform 1 [Theobroma cacao]